MLPGRAALNGPDSLQIAGTHGSSRLEILEKTSIASSVAGLKKGEQDDACRNDDENSRDNEYISHCHPQIFLLLCVVYFLRISWRLRLIRGKNESSEKE